jgi:trehalose 6-phosphate synthase
MPKVRDPNASAIWSAARLRSLVATVCGGEPIVVLANRQPVRHDRAPDGGIVVRRSAGGLVTALEPLVRACDGVWVAHGAGSADKAVVDGRDGLNVPPASSRYRLRRVWLNGAEERGYYYGFANEGLWPLCHRARVQPIFRVGDFNTYCAVNARFAGAVCEEADSDAPFVLVQDYHFALAPQMIRRRLPLSAIIAFWHIPWPSPAAFAACPWGRQLLEGILGSTLIGFQTPDDCANFVETVGRRLDAHVDHRRNVITHAGRRTTVRAYPVSVEGPSRLASESPSIESCRADVRRALHLPRDVKLGVGVDRLDYTKGIEEKLLAVERLLDCQPQLVGHFVFVQIAEPSRECLPAYRALRSRLRETATRINARFDTERYRPIMLLETRYEPKEVFRLLRAADFCYVGSLHDGMNLVAKEFVSARDDQRGVLILSKCAGAARELAEALIVDPCIVQHASDALAEALRMSDEEQSRRMRAMRRVISEFNIYRWAGEMLADGARLRTGSIPLPEANAGAKPLQPAALHA